VRRALLLLAAGACSGATSDARKPGSVPMCEQTWEPYACLDAGRYWESRGETTRAAEMFDHGCKRNLLDACIAGIKYSQELAVPACDMGYEPACLQAGAFLDGDIPRSVALLDRTCKRSPSQCGEAAKILVTRDEAAALALVRHACAIPERAACALGSQQPFKIAANQEAAARLGCDLDLGDACFRAAKLATTDRRALLARSCQLHHAPACEALGQLLSAP
jgi:hypothetical protein